MGAGRTNSAEFPGRVFHCSAQHSFPSVAFFVLKNKWGAGGAAAASRCPPTPAPQLGADPAGAAPAAAAARTPRPPRQPFSREEEAEEGARWRERARSNSPSGPLAVLGATPLPEDAAE